MSIATTRFVNLASVGCLVAFMMLSTTVGDDNKPPLPTEIDRRLLEGLDDLPPSRGQPPADIVGEDLGAAMPESTLAGLARLMQDVEQRIRRQDTSQTTTQLQSDIAAQLAKLLAAAEKNSARRTSTATAGGPSPTTSPTGAADSESEPPGRGAEDAEQPSELLNAAWGTLPERLRQQIQSPLQEEFLPRYERVIKQYYKRLAEQQQRLRD